MRIVDAHTFSHGRGRGVWTSGTTSAEFDIPNGCKPGASTLQVIVNGIASTGVGVTLKS